MIETPVRVPVWTRPPEAKPLLLSSTQVANMLAVSARTLWRLVRAKQIPQPIRFNRKLVKWRASDLAEFVAAMPNPPAGGAGEGGAA